MISIFTQKKFPVLLWNIFKGAIAQVNKKHYNGVPQWLERKLQTTKVK